MAGDWIKMRAALLTSPKVNGIARYLEADSRATRALSPTHDGVMSDIVTRDVMRYVTVASLLKVWAAANEHTRDGVFRNADLSDVDDMAGIPGFGEAMEAVGWASYNSEEDCVTLPNFNEYNTCGHARGADRQRRYRERKKQKSDEESDVTRDVTRDDREEKRREEKTTPVVPPSGGRKKTRSQIPENFQPDDTLLAWAKKNAPSVDPAAATQQFVDHHRAKGNTFADHRAAWRTWMSKAEEWAKSKAKPSQAWGDHTMVDFDEVSNA